MVEEFLYPIDRCLPNVTTAEQTQSQISRPSVGGPQNSDLTASRHSMEKPGAASAHSRFDRLSGSQTLNMGGVRGYPGEPVSDGREATFVPGDQSGYGAPMGISRCKFPSNLDGVRSDFGSTATANIYQCGGKSKANFSDTRKAPRNNPSALRVCTICRASHDRILSSLSCVQSFRWLVFRTPRIEYLREQLSGGTGSSVVKFAWISLLHNSAVSFYCSYSTRLVSSTAQELQGRLSPATRF